MEHSSHLEKAIRGALIALILIFFLFPIFWIFLMSFQTNEDILRIPPSLFFTPTLSNYQALITGKLFRPPARLTSLSCAICGTACCFPPSLSSSR